MEKFNHKAKHTTEALGMTEEQTDQLMHALTEFSMIILKGKVETVSEVVQLLAEKLSYKELVFLAANYVIGATEDVVKTKLSNIRLSL